MAGGKTQMRRKARDVRAAAYTADPAAGRRRIALASSAAIMLLVIGGLGLGALLEGDDAEPGDNFEGPPAAPLVDPDPPQGVTFDSDEDALTISWDPVEGASQYKVFAGPNSEVTVPLATDITGTSHRYEPTPEPGWCVVVQAVDAVSRTSDQSDEVCDP